MSDIGFPYASQDNLPCHCDCCTKKRKYLMTKEELEKICKMKRQQMCDWICKDCANKAELKCKSPVVTQHQGVCGACGNRKVIVSIRDYGWPQIEKGKFANE